MTSIYQFREIGERIRALREAVGYSERGGQQEFAAWLGFSSSQLNNWESGLKQPAVDNAIKICSMTGATLDWIYRGDPSGLPLSLASRLPGSSRRPQKAG